MDSVAKRPAGRWRWTLRGLAAAYALQLALIAAANLWPPVDVQDGAWRYVIIRGSCVCRLHDLIPVVGLIPQITGEPVTLTRTNIVTGEVLVTQGDQVGDFVSDYPALKGASYLRRLLDSR